LCRCVDKEEEEEQQQQQQQKYSYAINGHLNKHNNLSTICSITVKDILLVIEKKVIVIIIEL
jgi:hypothetical protein